MELSRFLIEGFNDAHCRDDDNTQRYGGRRLDIDRRQFSYTNYIPDRRLCENRRVCIDRRNEIDQRSGMERRSGKIIKMSRGNELRKGKERRSGLERRATFAAG